MGHYNRVVVRKLYAAERKSIDKCLLRYITELFPSLGVFQLNVFLLFERGPNLKHSADKKI